MRLHRRIGNARYLLLVVLAILGVIALLHTTTAQVPQVPDPHQGSSTPVREQNLDSSGWIKVHEQGQADVNITNGSLQVSGEVSVSNFPQTLELQMPPANTFGTAPGGEPSEETTVNFSTTVNATTIAMWDSSLTEDNNPEFWLRVLSPLVPNGWILQFNHDDGLDTHDIQTFPQPIPVSGLTVVCLNESNTCTVGIRVIGTAATP
jgi:hypothetical protein